MAFKVMANSLHKLFLLLLTTIVSTKGKFFECGSEQNGLLGMFISPSYPDNYAGNISCGWIIKTEADSRIHLRFTDFNFTRTEGCREDYLEIYDGRSKSASLIGRFCGEEIDDLITSSGNEMYVYMKTNDLQNARGFEVSWIAVHKYSILQSGPVKRQISTSGSDKCGQTEFTARQGVIKSPNYPRKYSSSTKCVYVIKTDSDHVISLSFEDFQLENHRVCRYDYVTISGASVDANKRYCGKISPSGRNAQVIKSRGNEIRIKFSSDTSTSERGFRAVWITSRKKSIKQSDCGGNFRKESGIITSPGYPKTSKKRVICSWKITVPEGARIKFEFLELNLLDHYRCGTGYVQLEDMVRSGFATLGTFCGTSKPKPLVTLGNVMSVGYFVNNDQRVKGFRAKWSTVYDNSTQSEKETLCNKRLTTYNGQIVHQSRQNCSWLIELASNMQIQLTVSKIKMADDPECNKEYFEARDGRSPSSPILFRTCGTLRPRPVTSSANYVYVSHKVFQRVRTTKVEMVWEAIDKRTENDIFKPGGCRVSPLDKIKLKYDKTFHHKGNKAPAYVPWVVQLYSQVHCAGMIIAPDWIIGAAHCFSKISSPSDWKVRAGDPIFHAQENTEQIVGVERIFVHESYDRKTFKNDIALVKLSKRLKFNKNVKSICLPAPSEKLKAGQECSVAGWGTDKYLSKPKEKLLQVFPKIVSRSKCNHAKMYNGKISDKMICAGGRGFDTCQGDGGSPLVCVNNDRYFAVGLASWGNGCAGKFGVYTDVRKYITWMKNIIRRKNRHR